jgi:drug/metabolite transporter (DMT)-like permease
LRAGILFAIAGAVALSAKAIFVKLAYQHGATPFTLTELRMAFALPIFLGVAIVSMRRASEATSLADKAWIVVLGCVGNYLAGYLDFKGLEFVSASVERLILFLYPTLVVLLSRAIFKTPFSSWQAAAVAISYAGIALLFAFDADAAQMPGAFSLGASLVFGSALAYAVYLVSSTHFIRRLGSVRFTAYAMTASCTVAVAHGLAAEPWSAFVVPVPVYGYALLLAVVSTVLPIFLISEALRRAGANRTALVGAVGPVVTILLAGAYLGERIVPYQIAGILFVLAGVVLVSVKAGR